MAEDDDLELDEFVLGAGIVGLGIALVVIVAIFNALEIDLASWGFNEWGTIALVAVIGLSLFVAVLLGSDEDGEQGGVFTSYGFALTILFLIVGIIALQTNFFGIGTNDPVYIDLDGDGQTDIAADQIPEGYVDYGSPQPYGFGNYGPANEGLLTDGEGAAGGCIAGAAAGGLAAWYFGPVGWVAGPTVGCALGAAGGFFASSSDFDGDPTTGW